MLLLEPQLLEVSQEGPASHKAAAVVTRRWGDSEEGSWRKAAAGAIVTRWANGVATNRLGSQEVGVSLLGARRGVQQNQCHCQPEGQGQWWLWFRWER